jgi:hypothetical protein
MSQYQPQYQPGPQQPPRRPMEARGTNATVTWDGRALLIRWSAGRGQVAVPAQQVAAVDIRPLDLACTVTTTAGRAYKVRYWPGRGSAFRAIAAAVSGMG